MELTGIISDIKAEVTSVIDWLEREIDHDGIIKKRIIETEEGTISLGAAFVYDGEPSKATTLVVTSRFTNKEGEYVPPAALNWPWTLWFVVRPLSLGEVELEWFCTQDALLGYKEEKLSLFRNKFKVPPDTSAKGTSSLQLPTQDDWRKRIITLGNERKVRLQLIERPEFTEAELERYKGATNGELITIAKCWIEAGAPGPKREQWSAFDLFVYEHTGLHLSRRRVDRKAAPFR